MDTLLNTLRDRSVATDVFRATAKDICNHLMQKTKRVITESEIMPDSVIIVFILRSGVAFLDAAIQSFPGTPVGVIGLRRDEKTLKPHQYYENLPPISSKSVIIILDPILATGGTATALVERLVSSGANVKNIHFTGILAAPPGYLRLTEMIPEKNVIIGAVDKGLDNSGMIVPGIGDFGDRYFGYSDRAIVS